MKRMILSASLLLLVAGFANAQTGNGGGSNGTSSASSVSTASKASNGGMNKGKSSTVTAQKTTKHSVNQNATSRNKTKASQNGGSSTLGNVGVTTHVVSENRQEHHYPDGQLATPTGHDAAPVNGGYSAIGKPANKANAARNTTTTTTAKKQQQ